MRYVIALIFSAALLLPVQTVFAQFTFASPQNDLSIIADPRYPGPNETVHLSLESSLLNISSASVTWTVGGKTVDAADTDSIDVRTGAAGTSITITAHTSDVNGEADASLTIVPASVDLLFDSNSYVPPFFKGRPLPSTGTNLRAQAIPHPPASIAASDIIYTWRQDDTVVASGRGRSSVSLPAPPLFGQSTIMVEARSVDGSYAASASITLPGIDPQATLYIDHPLFGIEYYNAAPSSVQVPEGEETFVAVPYFTQAAGPDDPRLAYQWSVNGQQVPAASGSASEITINSSGSNGIAQLSLSLTSPVNFYLSADQSWTVSFPGALGAGSIPGTTPQSSRSDAFHAGIQ